jgi:hypothetical protein
MLLLVGEMMIMEQMMAYTNMTAYDDHPDVTLRECR